MSQHVHASGPAYLRPGNIALVFVGATVGVSCRQLLMVVVPDFAGLALAVLLANVAGAFLLGVLLEGVARADFGESARVRLRLLLGTGALGGFTTYSALALALSQLWAEGSVWLGLAYGVTTVVLGALATWCGVVIGARLGRTRGGEHGRDDQWAA